MREVPVFLGWRASSIDRKVSVEAGTGMACLEGPIIYRCQKGTPIPIGSSRCGGPGLRIFPCYLGCCSIVGPLLKTKSTAQVIIFSSSTQLLARKMTSHAPSRSSICLLSEVARLANEGAPPGATYPRLSRAPLTSPQKALLPPGASPTSRGHMHSTLLPADGWIAPHLEHLFDRCRQRPRTGASCLTAKSRAGKLPGCRVLALGEFWWFQNHGFVK